jgi:hypothetical protein
VVLGERRTRLNVKRRPRGSVGLAYAHSQAGGRPRAEQTHAPMGIVEGVVLDDERGAVAASDHRDRGEAHGTVKLTSESQPRRNFRLLEHPIY